MSWSYSWAAGFTTSSTFSCSRRLRGQHISNSSRLPPLEEEGSLELVPTQVLETREKQLRNKVIKEYLVCSKDLPTEDTTWENEHIHQHPMLQLLEGKQS